MVVNNDHAIQPICRSSIKELGLTISSREVSWFSQVTPIPLVTQTLLVAQITKDSYWQVWQSLSILSYRAFLARHLLGAHRNSQASQLCSNQVSKTSQMTSQKAHARLGPRVTLAKN